MKISVVIPMYNASKSIIKALDSIKFQTCKADYQILIINDGSKDDSEVVVNQYILDNPRMNITLISQENSGVSKARNAGLKLAKGDYIAFLDSDDYWVDGKIAKQLSIFEKFSNIDFICGLRNNDTVKFPYTVDNELIEITTKKLLFRVIGQTSTAIFKRKVLDNTGYFDEKQKYSEDANFWLRVSIKNKMFLINDVLVRTDNDYGQKGLSSNLAEMENGVTKNVKEMRDIKAINKLEYLFFRAFSKAKYLRRKYI